MMNLNAVLRTSFFWVSILKASIVQHDYVYEFSKCIAVMNIYFTALWPESLVEPRGYGV